MTQKPPRDFVTLKDEEGNEREFAVEALFDMKDKSYALLSSEEDTMLMRVLDDELEGITDPDELEAILSAYQIAVDAAPAE